MNYDPPDPQETEDPWKRPSEWFKYRCRSCEHTDWVEEIVVDAFPPTEPAGFPAVVCPKCGGSFCHDASEPAKRSFEHPDCAS